MDACGAEKHWFALYTKPNHEFKAKSQIQTLDVETFLPELVIKKKWSDRIKTLSEPLIRGYVFIHSTEKERLKAVTSSAVIHTVCFEGHPAVIPDWQIEGLKKMLNREGEIFITDRIPAGARVKVISHPFEGLVGVVEENKNNEKYICIAIEIINRTVSVKLPADAVVKLLESQE